MNEVMKSEERVSRWFKMKDGLRIITFRGIKYYKKTEKKSIHKCIKHYKLTKNYPKLPWSIQKCPKVPKSTKKYLKVPKSTLKYLSIPKNI